MKGKGRGVFATDFFIKGDLIERCPVVVVKSKEVDDVCETVLAHYCFSWGKKGEDWAMALGYGSLYNHSYQPNAQCVEITGSKVMEIRCLRTIQRGEEIVIDYNGQEKTDRVWFEVK